MTRKGEFYAGSRLLEHLVPVIGLPLDQLNFLVCQLVGLLLAVPFRSVMAPTTTPPAARLIFELVAGIALSIFCFGHQVWYLVGQSLVSYLLMKYGSPRWSQMAVMAYCMIYLSVAHLFRQYYDYGGYTLDITGPMMIQTMKLTSLAFALSDGHRDDGQLTPDQKAQSIRQVPDLLSFFSFMFYFHGMMCGPLSFYSDYMAFINGTDIQQSFLSPSSANGHTDKIQENMVSEKDLKYTSAVVKRLLTSLVCGALMMILTPVLCPPEGLLEESFFEKSFLEKSLYLLVCMNVARQKYYFAWILGETVNVAAGFGFNGYDSSGEPRWDLNENVSIYDVEFAGSLKLIIDGWNKRTLVWLRRVVYDRAPTHRTVAVFAVSAFWHGFYPGYYLTFGSAALFTISARLVRRNVRPWFQTSEGKKKVYDVITFFFARVCNMYITFPFLTLELMPSLRLYRAQYCWMHLAAMVVILYFTVMGSASRKDGRSALPATQKPLKPE
ncbi:lysophospholipid acyltransferase 6-like [Babylonia areolata]|uniref:lysophospholipid acyltransferase 6-like n=1 Tax=Babylonia areolata TaxID=304850 RepID=UPI003FD68E8C